MVLQGLNLGLQFGTRMKKILVHTHSDEGASLKCIGTIKGEDGETLADLRVRLQENVYNLFISTCRLCYLHVYW